MENYFEFYGLSERFHIDEDELRSLFLAKSKKYHPDFFINDDKAYDEALEVTSINNKAYKALADSNLRLHHILEIHELLTDVKESLPPDFLMEMMEMNEMLMDAKMEGDERAITAVKQSVQAFEDSLALSLEESSTQFDSLSESGSDLTEVLEQLKLVYLKQKYLRRILKQV